MERSTASSARTVALRLEERLGHRWSGSESYREFAEQHLAQAIAAQGSLGLGRLLQKEVEPAAKSELATLATKSSSAAG